jgi:hypothetical protein
MSRVMETKRLLYRTNTTTSLALQAVAAPAPAATPTPSQRKKEPDQSFNCQACNWLGDRFLMSFLSFHTKVKPALLYI